MASTRQAFVWAFIGQTGSGKTTLACEMMKDWKKANKDGKIIGFDPHDVFRRAKLMTSYITENDINWPEILMTRICLNCKRLKHPEKEHCTKCGKNTWRFKFQDSLLAADDYRNLLTANSTPAGVLSLMGMKRRIGIDQIYIMHNPKLLLERLSYYLTHVSIFATESAAGDFSDKIAKYVPCQKGANLINQYVMELGGVDSDRYRAMYPNFPYVMISNENNNLNLMNMDEKIVNKLKAEGKI